MVTTFTATRKPAPPVGHFPDFDEWASAEWGRYSSNIVDLCRNELSTLEPGEPRAAFACRPLFEILAEEELNLRSELWNDWIEQSDDDLPDFDEHEVQIAELKRRLREESEQAALLNQTVQRLEARLSNHEAPSPCPCGHLTYAYYCPKCHRDLN